MKSEYDNLIFEHRSMYVKHGKVSEQLFPFMKDYPYNPSNFRFIGSPIDGINFEDDKIVFIEFKTGKSNLTDKQKRIKRVLLYFLQQKCKNWQYGNLRQMYGEWKRSKTF